MKLKVYEYSKCSTCRKALKYLNTKGISYEKIDIAEKAPTLKELKTMLEILKTSGKGLKNLFNTSGVHYRELKISDQLKTGLSEAAALKMMSENGRLVKRPFVLNDQKGTVGFDENEWKSLFN